MCRQWTGLRQNCCHRCFHCHRLHCRYHPQQKDHPFPQYHFLPLLRIRSVRPIRDPPLQMPVSHSSSSGSRLRLLSAKSSIPFFRSLFYSASFILPPFPARFPRLPYFLCIYQHSAYSLSGRVISTMQARMADASAMHFTVFLTICPLFLIFVLLLSF